MPSLLNQCESCIEIVFDECDDLIIAPDAGLYDNTTYYWLLTDTHGNVYKGSFEFSYGSFGVILKENLPEGFTTPAIGQFTIRFRISETSTEDIAITYGDTEYDCIQGSFQKVSELPIYDA